MSIIKNCNNAKDLLSIPEDIFAKMKGLSDEMDNSIIIKILSKLASLEQEFRYTTDSKSLFQISILSLMDETDKIEKLENKLKEMEAKLIAGEYP